MGRLGGEPERIWNASALPPAREAHTTQLFGLKSRSGRKGQMAKLIRAIVVIFILLAAHHAEAMCAWVLWQAHSRQGDPNNHSGRWTIVRAVPRQEDCELQLPAETHRAGEQQKPSRSAGGSDSGAVVEVTQFHCLPDTVDPRGPKGGSR
jgi:hypothetical protein